MDSRKEGKPALEFELLAPKAMFPLPVIQCPLKLREEMTALTAYAIQFPDLEPSKQERKQTRVKKEHECLLKNLRYQILEPYSRPKICQQSVLISP